MDNDRIVKNIVKEIYRECTVKHIHTFETFLTYYVKLLLLNPKWNISSYLNTNRTDVQQFIKYVVVQMNNQDTPNMVTMKMQLYFTCNFDKRHEKIAKRRQDLMQKLKPLQNELLEKRTAETAKDADSVYVQIVYFTTLYAGLGNPTYLTIFKESDAALKSILNEEELKEFLHLDKSRKIKQLNEMAHLVAGIRLFNRDCKKAGEGIEDLPKLLTKGIDATMQEMHKLLTYAMHHVNALTTALDKCYQTSINDDLYELVCILPEEISVDDLELFKDSLILYRQYELYLRKLMGELKKLEEFSTKTLEKFGEILNQTHGIVGDHIAIPVEKIFPSFTALAMNWYQMQDQTLLLTHLNQIMKNLEKYAATIVLDEDKVNIMLGTSGVTTDAERLTHASTLKLTSDNMKVIDSATLKQSDQMKLEYLGFCAWKLNEGKGVLIPGDVSLGVAHVLNMNFIFSTPDAGRAFARDPEGYILDTLQLARERPELINFLQLDQKLLIVNDIKQLVIPAAVIIEEDDCGVQTEDQPIVMHIDKNYKWNVWDLKREAIHLANIAKCRTVSTQTVQSEFRYHVRNQTVSPRDKNLQTMRDNQTNVPKPSTYIYGLRGRTDDKQWIMDLTEPIDKNAY